MIRRDKSPIGLRARLLGFKVIRRDDSVCVIRCPMWMSDEAVERAVRDGFNALAALGEDVEIARHGRYIRAERRADAELEKSQP